MTRKPAVVVVVVAADGAMGLLDPREYAGVVCPRAVASLRTNGQVLVKIRVWPAR